MYTELRAESVVPAIGDGMAPSESLLCSEAGRAPIYASRTRAKSFAYARSDEAISRMR